MDKFTSSGAVFHLLAEHPTPWRYVGSTAEGRKAMILDDENNIVVMEGAVKPVVFDLIWATYFHFLRP